MKEIVIDGSGKNALGNAVMLALLDSFKAAKDEPVLLSGRGDTFSAGLHLKEIASFSDAALADYLETLDELLRTVYEYPGPVVAHVNGHAIAGGCILAMCADVRIAPDNSSVRIGVNEVAIGLEFPPRIMRLLKARLSRSSIDRVILEAGLYAPHDALRLGLVDEVSSDAGAVARAMCEKLASYPAETYRATKRTLRKGLLDVDAQEMKSFREVMLPRWCARREALARMLAR